MLLDTKALLLETIRKRGKASVNELVSNLPQKRSRQWVSTILKELEKEGKVIGSKSGRFTFYVLPDQLDLIGKKITRQYINKGLDEDIIFDQLSTEITFLKELKEDVRSILGYAFTEMVNNAIEHSQSDNIEVSFEDRDDTIVFEVRDSGIGVFKNIMQKKKLNSEIEAIQELMKGKTTTLPHSHSGEGIFFTSKIADLFVLDSFKYRLRVDNTIKDVFVEPIEVLTGTKVRFKLAKNTKKHLNDVFYEYAAEPGSHSFDKTKVHVKLFKAGTVYISRSQARRLMSNLEKYKLIVLDFTDISTVGQAFADEVFRVFASKHPDIKIQPINMAETVSFMINRVSKPQLTFLPDDRQEK